MPKKARDTQPKTPFSFPSSVEEFLAAGYKHAEWVALPGGKGYFSVSKRDYHQAGIEALQAARKFLMNRQAATMKQPEA